MKKQDTFQEFEPEENNNEEIEEPFNPKDIKIEIKQLSLDIIIKRLNYEEISFFSDYQRSPNLWDNQKQSLLIESLLLQIPLPAFYFYIKDDNTWEVIDGLQRLSSIKNFVIDKTLKLEKLEYIKQYNGCMYDSIPRVLQRTIDETNITAYLLQKGTPIDVKFNIFKRINTGGTTLTPQEIRHVLHLGIPADFVKELGDILVMVFKKRINKEIHQERQEDRELATRFIAFYLNGYETYQPVLENFLNHGMQAIRSLTDTKRAEIKIIFEQALNLAFDIFGDKAFQNRPKKNQKNSPINKALFEAVTVQLAHCSLKEEQNKLRSKKEIINEYLLAEMQSGSEFSKSISSSTDRKTSIPIRHKTIINVINQVISS